MADAQDRHLPASAKRLRKARADGQVPRSRELAHFAVVAIGGAILAAGAPSLLDWLREMLAAGLRFDLGDLARPAAMTQRLADRALTGVAVALGCGLASAALAVGAAVASGGWNLTWHPLAPRLDKLDPIAGLGRMFSRGRLVDTGKACLLALVIGAAASLWLRAHLGSFQDALALPLPAALAVVARTLRAGLAVPLLLLAAFAAVDVPLQRFLWRSRLKMSTQEAKQEHKDAEGSVEVKGKIKARMREMRRRRMLAAVPRADLVVMNPTHYAVALKYDEHAMAAPRVLAKGADLLALRIRDLARDAKVPVLQAAPLARALYAHCEVDDEIPQRLFAAVAQVLAHVYQLRAALAGRGTMPGELPTIAVPPDLDPAAAPTATP